MTENRKRRRTDREADIPAVIPRVEVVNGEPVIATRHVVDPSPVPRSLVIILILLGAFSVGYSVFQQEQRGDDVAQAQRIDTHQLERIEGLVLDLQRQDQQSIRERERLRGLVIALSSAETDEERLVLLREFAAADQADPQTSPPALPPATGG